MGSVEFNYGRGLKNPEQSGFSRNGVSVEINDQNQVMNIEMTALGKHSIPPGIFETLQSESAERQNTLMDLNNHPMNIYRNWKENTDPNLTSQHQDRIIIMSESKTDPFDKKGIVIDKEVKDGSFFAAVSLKVIDGKPTQEIDILKFHDGEFQPVVPAAPDQSGKPKILHATQILGHIKDACDMQEYSHQKGTLEGWEYAFPPTKRRRVNQDGLNKAGVPTYDVTKSWSYAGNTPELIEDYEDPKSFQSVMAFVAANMEICADVAAGKFSIVSTNFRSEGQLLKRINPDILLGGINFTFISGTPGTRISQHADNPKFQLMLQRVQDSLDGAPEVIERLSLGKEKADDWWKLVGEKMRNLDFLLYRTFSYDQELSTQSPMEIIQIPHPIPEDILDKSQARAHIGGLINKELAEENKVVLLAGESSDGAFEKRAEQVIELAKEDQNLVVLAPMSRDDPRLSKLQLPENVFPVGFRPDWMDIIGGADVSFIRGSWGEILDVVAAGNVPVITSPGIVRESANVNDVQFLVEVSGERAVNVSLFIEELQKNGVKPETINGLLADVLGDHPDDEIKNAVRFALRTDVAAEIQAALKKIRKDGIKQIVDIHESLLSKGRAFTQEEIRGLHATIWN